MSNAEKHSLDQNKTKNAFHNAAQDYDSVTAMQREVGDRLLSRLDFVQHKPKVIADIGAGTGIATGKLIQRYKDANVLALDIAKGMLLVNNENNTENPASCAVADMHNIPLLHESIDMIFSNLAMQWSNDLLKVLDEYHRVMQDEGLLHFATFGPQTLSEFKQSWHVADPEVSHVNSFYSVGDVGDMLIESGFQDVVVDSEIITLHYQDVMQVMRELKTLGASNRTHGRSRALTGKDKMKRMIYEYEKLREGEGVPVSYEIIYGHCWK